MACVQATTSSVSQKSVTLAGLLDLSLFPPAQCPQLVVCCLQRGASGSAPLSLHLCLDLAALTHPFPDANLLIMECAWDVTHEMRGFSFINAIVADLAVAAASDVFAACVQRVRVQASRVGNVVVLIKKLSRGALLLPPETSGIAPCCARCCITYFRFRNCPPSPREGMGAAGAGCAAARGGGGPGSLREDCTTGAGARTDTLGTAT